jgi:hypothetical protein
MAFSVVETKIVNPAKKGRSMAKQRRKMSAKQIRFFGSKRQRAALKAKRSNAAKHHVVKHRAAKRSNPRPKPRFRTKHRTRRNPVPEIISLTLGNPARKKGTKVAKTRHFKTKHRAASRKNAGRPRKSVKRYNFSMRKRNPAGLGTPIQWLKGGVGVLAGVVVTRALPQAILPSSNSGIIGYLMNAGTAIAAAYGTHMVTKDPVLTASVAAGGFAALIARVIGDMTSFGSYLSLTGMADYQFSNFNQPQHLTAWKNAQYTLPAAPQALTTSLYGTDVGSRGGNC